MIIVVSRGRLGNELFFIAAAHKIRKKNERIIGFGFESLAAAPRAARKQVLSAAFSRDVLQRLSLKKVFHHLIRLGLVSEFREESGELFFSKGTLPVTIMRRGFFQLDKVGAPEAIQNLVHTASRLCRSDTGVSGQPGGELKVSSFGPTCFVQIRRGDFLTFPNREDAVAVPRAWFVEQMKEIEELHPRVTVLIFSDDSDWCAREFLPSKNVKVIEQTPICSVYLMSQCQMGILSPSTLAWWGAKLASASSAGPFIAPLYWLGWPKQTWAGSPLQDSTFLDFRQISAGLAPGTNLM